MATKNAVIVGAGKIGRGYLADVLSRDGWKITFIGHRPETVNALRAQGYYTLFKMTDAGEKEYRIEGYQALCSSTERDACMDALCEADVVFVSVYPGAYQDIADLLAGAISARSTKGIEKPMNTAFFVNIVGTARKFDAMLRKKLAGQEMAYFEKWVGLSDALTNSGGYLPTQEMLAKDKLAIQVSDEADILPVGDREFKHPLPDSGRFEYLDHIEGRLYRNVWCGNLVHCTVAAMAQNKGLRFVEEGGRDAYICAIAKQASEEGMRGIAAEFGFAKEDMAKFAKENDPAHYGEATSSDTVGRVAADPRRKLAREDRLVGPALLAAKHGITPFFIARAIAYVFLFDDREINGYAELQDIIAGQGIEKAIGDYCQLDLAKPQEKLLYDLILGHYNEIGAEA